METLHLLLKNLTSSGAFSFSGLFRDDLEGEIWFIIGTD